MVTLVAAHNDNPNRSGGRDPNSQKCRSMLQMPHDRTESWSDHCLGWLALHGLGVHVVGGEAELKSSGEISLPVHSCGPGPPRHLSFHALFESSTHLDAVLGSLPKFSMSSSSAVVWHPPAAGTYSVKLRFHFYGDSCDDPDDLSNQTTKFIGGWKKKRNRILVGGSMSMPNCVMLGSHNCPSRR